MEGFINSSKTKGAEHVSPDEVAKARESLAILEGNILEQLKTLVDMFDYQGMNPEVIFQTLMERGKRKHVGPDAQKKILLDIRSMLAWYVMRGSALNDKNVKRTNEVGKQAINMLMTDYNILVRNPTGSKDITLARVAGTFPDIVALFLAKGVGKIVFKLDHLPYYLSFPSGAALIPMSSTYDDTFNLWVQWSALFSQLVDAPGSQDEANARRYGEIMRKSSWISETRRQTVLTACHELMSSNTHPHAPTYKQALAASKSSNNRRETE